METGENRVNAAYLNATLKEDKYLQQPNGFKTLGQEDKVIYGLRQSGHEWYEDLMHTLTSVGFK